MFKKLLKTVSKPITSIIITILIIVSSLYGFGILKDIPCGEGVLKGLNRTFIHTNWEHAFANVFALVILSRIEEKHGSILFAKLIIQILLLETIIEIIAFQFFEIPCAIGFSGIIFGLIAWELTNDKDIDITLFLTLAGMVVYPSLLNNKASLIGHSIGALSGMIISVYYKSWDI